MIKYPYRKCRMP